MKRKRKTVTVTRWQIGADGVEEITVKWNRERQTASLKINGVVSKRTSGAEAEKLFRQQGLLM